MSMPQVETVPAARAARLLSALSAGSACLVPAPEDPARHELRRPGEAAPLMVVATTLVEEMRRRDLLEPAGGSTLRASEAGRAWLARHMRPHDPFRAQHLEIATGQDGETGRPVFTVENESPLAWLRRRKGTDGRPMLDEAQYAAGERLRRDFTLARMMPRVTADWTGIAAPRGRRGPARDPAAAMDTAVAARQRVEKALDAIGPTLASLLVDVCCFLTGLEAAERGRSWPRRSGKIVLQIALDRLAEHYGIATRAEGPRRGRRILHWGEEGYRPTIDG